MSATVETIDKYILPVVPLRSIAAYPGMPISLELGRKRSITALEEANATTGKLFLIPQKDPNTEHPFAEDLYEIGVIAKIKSVSKTKDNTARVLFECEDRAMITNVMQRKGYIAAEGLRKRVELKENGGVKGEAMLGEAKRIFTRFSELSPALPDEVKFAVDTVRDPGLLADFLAANVLTRFESKIKILYEFDPMRRIEMLLFCMEEEITVLEYEADIARKVRSAIDDNQRDYYLREQLNVIRDELGMNDDDDDYENRIRAAKLPEEVEAKLLKENGRLLKTPFGSAEGNVIRNYIETCLELPWGKNTTEKKTLKQARKILDRDHEGIEDVKKRILEYIAVRQMTDTPSTQIICLVGPPGVGKTSVARSIADALGRKYVRVALGGIRDEADIRGHRKTYVGAMPGRIIEAIGRAETSSPLILLDEIDKLANDFRGDPASALLEVLDSEQNKFFRDHFLELPYDLSDCVFIATANDPAGIPAPLYDRMEIIELKTYTYAERLAIAKRHLIPKQLKKHGITSAQLKITDAAINKIIRSYTREAGVRNLEREIANVCRKCAAGIAGGDFEKLTVRPDTLTELLGPEKLIPESIPAKSTVGLVNGLAYTESGGAMLPIEVALLPGSGKIELTGSLGDVMKESARIAVSFMRSRADILGIDPDFYKTKDIHIHAPEGAVPKDGPSAGIAMCVCLASALTGRPVDRTIAMTGEVSLLGRAIAIGGLKEKTLAALRAGAKTVIIPADNARDMQKLPDEVKNGLRFICVEDADTAIDIALLPAKKAAKAEKTEESEFSPISTAKKSYVPLNCASKNNE
ncbi:MAG: endopeptidase La [Clostridia bacterium]|nr:endopeptidase La [Clostridia bacterium]